MLGAVIGDIVGSRFEFENIKSTDFELFSSECDFTDDSVCTFATIDWLSNRRSESYQSVLQDWCRRYNNPMGGYGDSFYRWIRSGDPKPYNSWGNGSAMRVSPVGFWFNSLDETIRVAEQTAIITHNHPEGIKGAVSVAVAIYLARTIKDKESIRSYISSNFGYNLNRSCDDIRPMYEFDESCQGSVPESIIAFLDSNSFEGAIRLAISLGGDSDTLACITGGIAEAYYGVPDNIKCKAVEYLPFEMSSIVDRLYSRLVIPPTISVNRR